MIEELHRLVLEHEELAFMDVAERRVALRSLVATRVSGEQVGRMVTALEDEIAGYGILGPLTRLSGVTDVLVNGPSDIWIERDGKLERSDASFRDVDDLYAHLDRLIGLARMRVDAAAPFADGRLPDGSRLNVVLPPIAPDGPLLSIRLFGRRLMTLDDLVEGGAMSEPIREQLERAIHERANILISGRTGAGKTTLLSALLACADPDERVVTIEETRELRTLGHHVVSLSTRPPNVEGRGSVEQGELLRNCLRMRPDRIVIGEARGAEAWVALSAMATGHRGCLLTIHAGAPSEALTRLRALARQAKDSTMELIDAHLSSLDLIVQMDVEEGLRRVTDVVRV